MAKQEFAKFTRLTPDRDNITPSISGDDSIFQEMLATLNNPNETLERMRIKEPPRELPDKDMSEDIWEALDRFVPWHNENKYKFGSNANYNKGWKIRKEAPQ